MNSCIYFGGFSEDGTQGFRILGKYSSTLQLQNTVYFINMYLLRFHRAFTSTDCELVKKNSLEKRNGITKIKS